MGVGAIVAVRAMALWGTGVMGQSAMAGRIRLHNLAAVILLVASAQGGYLDADINSTAEWFLLQRTNELTCFRRGDGVPMFWKGPLGNDKAEGASVQFPGGGEDYRCQNKCSSGWCSRWTNRDSSWTCKRSLHSAFDSRWKGLPEVTTNSYNVKKLTDLPRNVSVHVSVKTPQNAHLLFCEGDLNLDEYDNNATCYFVILRGWVNDYNPKDRDRSVIRKCPVDKFPIKPRTRDGRPRFPKDPCDKTRISRNDIMPLSQDGWTHLQVSWNGSTLSVTMVDQDEPFLQWTDNDKSYQPTKLYVRSEVKAIWKAHKYNYFESPTGGEFGSLTTSLEGSVPCMHVMYRLKQSSYLSVRAGGEDLKSTPLKDDGHWHEARFEGAPSTYSRDVTFTVATTGPAAIGLLRVCTPGDDAHVLKLNHWQSNKYSCALLADPEKALKPGTADPSATCPGCAEALAPFWVSSKLECTYSAVCFPDGKDGQKCTCEPGCKGAHCAIPHVVLKSRPSVVEEGPTNITLLLDSLETTWKKQPAHLIQFIFRENNPYSNWAFTRDFPLHNLRVPVRFTLLDLKPDVEYEINYKLKFDNIFTRYVGDSSITARTNCTDRIYVVNATSEVITVELTDIENACRPENYNVTATDSDGSANFLFKMTSSTTFEETDLQPLTKYSVTITHRGRVVTSMPVTTKQQKPPPVMHLQNYAANSTTVWVRFRGPDPDSFRGYLKGFYVKTTRSRHRTFFNLTHTCTVWKELHCNWYTGLFEGQQYDIQVAAVNGDELPGEYTTVAATARAKAPSPPTNLKPTLDSSRNLQLRWGHPDLPGAPLTSFSVSVERLNSSLVDTEGLQTTMFFNKTIEEEQLEYAYVVESLLPSSQFSVLVWAVGEEVGPGEAATHSVNTPDAAPFFPPGTKLEIAASKTLLTFRLPEETPRFLVKKRSACFVVVAQRDGAPPTGNRTTGLNNITNTLLSSVHSQNRDSPVATWIAARVECGETENVTVGKVEEKEGETSEEEEGGGRVTAPGEPYGDVDPFGEVSTFNHALRPSTRYGVILFAATVGEGSSLLVGSPLVAEAVTLGLDGKATGRRGGGGGTEGYAALALLLLLLLLPLAFFLYRRRKRSAGAAEIDVVPLQDRKKKKKKRVVFPTEDEEVIKKALPPAPPTPTVTPTGPPPARPAPWLRPRSKAVALVEPEVPSHRVAVARFETYARSTAASGELARQHALFPRGLHQPCEAGKRPENKPKNRYANLLPYDATRVKLRYPLKPSCPPRPDPQYANIPGAKDDPQYENIPGMPDEQQYAVILPKGDDPQYVNIDEMQGPANRTSAQMEPGADYINASSIEGYGGRRYIATQGPKPDTVAHFWHCVWQEDVHTIVMLTGLVEEGKTKCEQYWPEPGKPLQVGHGLSARAAAPERVRAYHVERDIILTLQFGNDGDMAGQVQEREILQLHCTSWPDHGVPVNITPVARLVRMVRERVRSKDPGRPDEIPPLLVHCSAGAGRTGTVILTDACADMAAAEGAVDLLLLLGRIRACRANLVDNAEQYVLAHALLLELLLEEGTAVPGTEDVREAVQQLRNQGLLDRQFLRLARHPPLPLSPSLLKQMTDKKHEFDPRLDRSPDILPGAVGVVLLRPMGEGDSEYVNAVWVDDVERRNAAIATQLPLPSTTSTLWGLVTQSHAPLIVALHRPAPDDPESPSWFPEGAAGAVVALPGGVDVKLLDSDMLPHCTRLRVRATLPDSAEAVVEILQMEGWASDSPLPPSPSALLALWREMDRRRSAVQPYIVLCRDGALGCGLFLALDHTLQLLRIEGSLDPADAVRTLRPPRPAFVTQQEQFDFLFDAALEHIQQFETYANLQ